MNSFHETRAHSRYDIRISAEVASGGVVFTCTTKDLSIGGVGVTCDRELTVGHPALVTLFVVVDDIEDLGTDPLELAADIVWCKSIDKESYLAGLKFSDMDQESRVYLQRLLTVAQNESP